LQIPKIVLTRCPYEIISLGMLSTKCLTWQAPVLAITANPDMFIAVIVCNAAVFGLLNIILTLHVAVGKRPKKYIF